MKGQSTCFSGGARGSDSLFGACAEAVGHKVIHYSFKEHKSKLNRSILNKDQLSKADPYLLLANEWLNRKFPTYSEYTNNLLRRNFYQVKESDMIYAITDLDKDGFPKGGTAWAVIMGIIVNVDEIYLFDQTTEKWFRFVDIGQHPRKITWDQVKQPPSPKGAYTGIGTQKLLSSGIKAVKNLYQID